MIYLWFFIISTQWCNNTVFFLQKNIIKYMQIQAKHIIALILNAIAKKSQITTKLSEAYEKHWKCVETHKYDRTNETALKIME